MKVQQAQQPQQSEGLPMTEQPIVLCEPVGGGTLYVGVSGVHFVRDTTPIPPSLDTALRIATLMRERRPGRTDTSFASILVILGGSHSIAALQTDG